MKRPIMFFLIICFFILHFPGLRAQGFYFGRNKVHYTNFNWQVLQTQHFNIYYYPEMRDMTEKGAAFAEESFNILESKFNFSVTRRIPLIFYSSHLHFEQTNVSPGFIPEGVGGFFEYIKGRVVIPANGDIFRFKRVIRHELVHVFMHAKLYNVFRKHNMVEGAPVPLWFTEGLAEFWSGGWDAMGEMVLKDAVLNNYIVGLKNIYSINGTFMMYKVGQDVLSYIAQKFGPDKILQLLENLWQFNSFQECFKDVIGLSYKEFDFQYLYHLKKRYYPLLAKQESSAQMDITVARDGYNFKPAFYKDRLHSYLVFMGNRTGYSSIYRRPLKAVKIGETDKAELLIKGEASSDFEAFHVFDSKISVNKQGVMAFSSKSGAGDALYLYDMHKRRILAKRRFKGIVGLYSPSWSADGREIVFSGLGVNGYLDLYVFNTVQQTLSKFTDDFYADKDPVFSADGRYLIFSSDRGRFGPKGATNIFALDRQAQIIRPLTSGRFKDRSPALSADGNYLAFTSDRGGTFNIFILKNPLSKTLRPVLQLTHSIGTLFDPAWTSENNLLYATFEDGKFQIRLRKNVWNEILQLKPQKQNRKALPVSHWQFGNIPLSQIKARHPYIKKFSLDFAQTQLTQDPLFGTSGGAQFAFTDVLGNDQYYVLIFNNARTSGSLLNSFNFAVSKISLQKRINYALRVYRFAGYYYNPADSYYYEESVGGSVTLLYPLSMFSRLSFSQNFYYSDKDWFIEKRRYAYINSGYISYVFDNSLWSSTGPIDGQRFNITVGNTYDFAFSRVSYVTGLIDLRKYFRLSLRNTYAVRFFSLFNQGKESRQFYFGGSWDLRLYPRWGLHGRRIFLLSQEWRFPLVDLLRIRFPFFDLGFRHIRGAVFADAGNAWNDKWLGLRGSFGLGVRFSLGRVLVLRLDMGKRTDFKTISKSTISQFFFGWDF